MRSQPRLFLSLATLILAAGCATSVTNLTPGTHVRNPSGLYHFEVALDQPVPPARTESFEPFVIVGTRLYPMEPTPVVSNRWETMVSIPPSKEKIRYQYKFDYQTASQGLKSKLSRHYQLKIVPTPAEIPYR